jgi:hypothetical protein
MKTKDRDSQITQYFLETLQAKDQAKEINIKPILQGIKSRIQPSVWVDKKHPKENFIRENLFLDLKALLKAQCKEEPETKIKRADWRLIVNTLYNIEDLTKFILGQGGLQ